MDQERDPSSSGGGGPSEFSLSGPTPDESVRDSGQGAAAESVSAAGPSRPNAIRRSSTLPNRHADYHGSGEASTPRHRGQSISARDLHPTQSNHRVSIATDDRAPRSSEDGKAKDDDSTRSSRRRRKNTSTSRPRASTVTRRPTLPGNAAPPGGFSLAGPAETAAPTHQPYVDPDYAVLNPAYEQPANARPVWSLAKPLPRVVRPGMVPSQEEVAQPPDTDGHSEEKEVDPDVEKGRVEQTLNLGKISTQIRDALEQRESNFLQRVASRASTSLRRDSRASVSDSTGGVLRRDSRVSELRREAALSGSGTAPPPLLTPPVEIPEAENRGAFPFPDMLGDGPKSTKTSPEPEPVVEHDNRYPDDASNAATEIDNTEGWYDEDLALQPYWSEDEIHNHHTHWSVLRTRYREPLAEVLAVTVNLTLGFCASLAATISQYSGGSYDGLSVNFSWGFGAMIAIYIAGGISGAHLNPNISILLWIYRGFPLRKVPQYVLAQVTGAFLAALISYGIYQTQIEALMHAAEATQSVTQVTENVAKVFITFPREVEVNAATAFFTEFVATAILCIVVLALGDDTNAPPGAGMSAFVMGLVVVVISNAFSTNTGCALNPTRDLAPRFALLALGYGADVAFGEGGWWWYWFLGPLAGTLAGTVFGGAVYDIAIFVGGESPINYPRRRIKRAHVKWRRKWGRRLRVRKRWKKDGAEDVGEKI